MSDNPETLRDERTVSVENVGYKLAWMVLAFGAMLLVVVRGLLFDEAAWDLLGLVLLSSGVGTFYQMRRKIISWRMIKPVIWIGVASGVVAAVIAVLLALYH